MSASRKIHEGPDVWVGDCRDVMTHNLEPESVQCAVCSPPYWITGDYGVMPWVGGSGDCDHEAAVQTVRGTAKKWAHRCPSCGAVQDPRRVGRTETMEDYIQQMVEVGRGVRRVLRDDGTWWLNLDDAYSGGHRLLVPHRVAIALAEDGWVVRQDIVYSKLAPFHESAKNRCTRSHEYIFLLTKQVTGYFYDAEAIRDGDHNRYSVWRINHRGHTGIHRGTFPPRIPELCILAGTPEKGSCAGCGAPLTKNEFGEWSDPCCGAGTTPSLVLDPFHGSGTTMRTALSLGRRAVGIELVEEHACESISLLR